MIATANRFTLLLRGQLGYNREVYLAASVWASALFVTVLLALYALAFVLILFPARVLQLHARLSRRGWGEREPPDWIDDLMDPLNKFVIGSRKSYLMQGPTEPNRFPRAIWYFRILGLVLFLGVTVPLLWATLIQ